MSAKTYFDGADAVDSYFATSDRAAPPTHDFDIPNNSSTPATIAVGGSFSGTIEVASDADWIAVTLVAGQAYTFNLAGAAVGGVADTILELVTADGTVLANNDDIVPGGINLNSRIAYTATTSGVFYLSASAYSGFTGDYVLSAAAGPPATPLPVYSMAQIADYLTDGYWNATERSRQAFGTTTITYNIEDLTAAGRVWAEEAFHAWAGVTGLNFQRVMSGGQITFDDDQSGANAINIAVGGVTQSSHINVITGWAGPGRNGYTYQTYIHEIGHSLGLGHAGNYNLVGGWSANTGASNHFVNDSWQATVMSYFDQDDNTYVNATRAYVIGPMIADIIAIQTLYGVPTNVRATNTTYGFNSNSIAEHGFAQYTEGNMVAFAIFDSGGIDTLDASGFVGNQVINLGPGTYSNIGGEVGNIGIAVNTIIENAVGGQGNDTITGNVANNELWGMNGNDTINAGQGNDILHGGAGADALNGALGFDYADYGTANLGLTADLNNNGTNTGHAFGDIYSGIEGLNGSIYSDTLRGDAANNTINGRGGDDTLTGGLGADTLGGGAGNDTLLGGQGWDFLFGRDGNDILNGAKGNDQLTGEAGNDTFIVTTGTMADTITDFNGGAGVGDVLHIGMGAAFNSVVEVINASTEVGGNVVINFGNGDSITLLNFNVANFANNDFVFI